MYNVMFCSHMCPRGCAIRLSTIRDHWPLKSLNMLRINSLVYFPIRVLTISDGQEFEHHYYTVLIFNVFHNFTHSFKYANNFNKIVIIIGFLQLWLFSVYYDQSAHHADHCFTSTISDNATQTSWTDIISKM